MRRLLALALFLLATIGAAQAQDRSELENRLSQEYLGKALILRGLYQGSVLTFDADGIKIDGGEPGPWTLAGEVRVDGVHLDLNSLKIDGWRLFLVYDQGKDAFHDLPRAAPKGRSVLITIRLAPGAPTGDSLHAAIYKVFLAPTDHLADIVPSCWKGFVRRSEGSAAGSGQSDEQLVSPGPGVSAPGVTYSPDPKYPDLARKAGVEGTVVLYLVIGPEGLPHSIQVARPLGLGFDEEAVEAVQHWKFKPARKDGQPVSVAINVEINFHPY